MARKRDYIDQACESWASIQREIAGVQEPRTFLGAPRCTLEARRDLHAGSRSEGRVSQNWPEVYSHAGLCVAQAYNQMEWVLREALWLHYVVRAPVKAKLHTLNVAKRVYWERVGRARSFVDGWLACDAEGG